MKLSLKIKKRSQNEWIILVVLFIILAMATWSELLMLPDAVKYFADLLWLFLLLTIITNKFKARNKSLKNLRDYVLVFWMITVLGFLMNWGSPLYYLWGFRNNFRFFVYLFACAMFLREETAEDILQTFDKLFYLNFLIVLIQFFIFGKKRDDLGGIFGVQSGCNGILNLYLCIMTIKNVLDYFYNEKKIQKCILECAMSLIIAALAELKFFFVLFVVIVVAASLFTSFSYKKLIIIVATALVLQLGISLMTMIFPIFKGFFSLENMYRTAASAEGYTGNGEMNRLTAIPIAWERFLNTWPQKLFGLGLGNCDTSALKFLNTPFYRRYGYLRYDWFSSSFMFLETGILGLVTYVFFFVKLFFEAKKRERRGEASKKWCQMAMITAIVSMLLLIYNASLREDGAYMIYFILALPFIDRRESASPRRSPYNYNPYIQRGEG